MVISIGGGRGGVGCDLEYAVVGGEVVEEANLGAGDGLDVSDGGFRSAECDGANETEFGAAALHVLE